MNKKIIEKLRQLPEKPGTYQMLNKAKQIIYVGKAKNLKQRVSSYFRGVHDLKTTLLVNDVEDFTFIITKSEKEALLLEISQIKKHLPKYNIQFIGSNSYPYIEITDELYPRLRITRSIKNKNNKYCFGPFPDVSSARNTLKVLNAIFPFRKCVKLPKKTCLYYSINQCLAPCEFEIDPFEFTKMKQDVKKFLSGKTKSYIDKYKEKMEYYSNKLEYEKALEYKNLIYAIEKTTEKQQVIFLDDLNRDILNFVTYDNYLAINILFMRQGRLLFSTSKILSYYLGIDDVLSTYLIDYYDKNLIPDEIILPYGYDWSLLNEFYGKTITTPRKGRKYKLLEMAKENAKLYMESNLKKYLDKENKTIIALENLESILKLDNIKRIDIFDNSNISGQYLVSAMVVFENGLPNKNEYRKYRIKTVNNSDDYHMMQEVIYRRYQNLLVENLTHPDLIIVDGGIHQLRAAKDVLNKLNLDIPVIGLIKDNHHKTKSILAWDESEILLDRHSFVYSLLYNMQEEVHRFAIKYHRLVAGKAIYASILDSIPKVGKATKEKLLKKYKTLDKIKSAPREELRSLRISNEAIDNIYLALKDIKTK